MSDCVGCECEQECRGSISLHDFFEKLCFPPYAAFQFAQWRNDYPNTVIPMNDSVSPCQSIVFERCHSGCTIAGRTQICEAIEQADRAFLDYMHYPPAPAPFCAEFYFGRSGLTLNNTGQQSFRGGTLQLDHYKIKALGKQTLTLLETLAFDAATQLSDTNGDNLYDRATITIAKPVGVAASELALYFVEADRGNSPCCRWEIRPLTVKETATEFIITIPSWVMAMPKVYDSYSIVDTNEEVLDPQQLSIYPTQIELWRRWVDSTLAVNIQRKPINCTCGRTVGDACHECIDIDACLISAEQGLIDVQLPADLNSCGCCPRCVDRMFVFYTAGSCGHETLIARLAASFMKSDVCCHGTTQVGYYQNDYVAVSERGRVLTSLLDAERASIFGTKRGGIEALRALRGKKKMRIAAI